MPALYSHTSRADGTTLTAAIYNADHQNHITNGIPTMFDDASDDVTAMQTTVDPGGVGAESLATNLAGELHRIRFMIKAITGAAQWYDQGFSGGITLHSGGVRVVDGSAAAPSLSFGSDIDTGIYRNAGGVVSIASDGSESLRIGASVISLVQHRFDDGTVGAPGIVFAQDTNTGLYQSAVGRIDFSVDGDLKMSLDAGLFMDGATGGDQGNGTVNAAGLYEAGRLISERLTGTNTTSSTAFTLSQEDAGGRIRTTAGSAVTITVSSVTSHVEGETYLITRAGAGEVTLSGSGVTLNKPSDRLLKPRVQWSTIGISFLSSTVADVYGDLEPA